MERLILEYSEGDGCTYSCTQTLPIIHESKERAVSELETLLLQYLVAIEERDQRLVASNKVLEKTRNAVIALHGKKGKEKELEKAAADFTKANVANREIFDSVPGEFQFGGQTLYYDNFFYRDDANKQQPQPPNIYTLDEFFAEVSKQASQPVA